MFDRLLRVVAPCLPSLLRAEDAAFIFSRPSLKARALRMFVESFPQVVSVLMFSKPNLKQLVLMLLKKFISQVRCVRLVSRL